MRRAGTAVVVLALIAPLALAEKPKDKPKPKDWDDQQAEDDSYWSRVANPNRSKYKELVQEATILAANPQTAGNLRRAEELFREAIAVEPDEPYARFVLADMLHNQQRYAECAEQYMAIVELDPEWEDPRDSKKMPSYIPFRAGFCLALSGRLEESIVQYQRIVALDYVGLPTPDVTRGWVHWNMADSYMALGRLEEAIVEYQTALDYDKNTKMLWFALAVAYDRDEQVELSRDGMDKALAADPQMREIVSDRIAYLPPEDEDYYNGLAHQASFDGTGRRVGQRVRAIAYFRRYVATVEEQTWIPRAKAHLVELGSPAITERDIEVRPADAKEKDAIVKAIVAAGSDLQKCLEGGEEYGVLRLNITLSPPLPPEKKGKKPTPVPAKIETLDTPADELPDAQTSAGCVISRVKQINLPAMPKALTGITVDLIAP